MTDLDLTGRKALVTGGAQGLGEGMAQALADAGAHVVVADLQDDLGAKVAESLGEGHGFVKPENIAELYNRMEAFLDKHIGTDAKVATFGFPRAPRAKPPSRSRRKTS